METVIPVTKPYLPPKQKLFQYLESVYQNNILTNNGPLVQQLTSRLEDYLQVKNILLVSSGAVALQIAYKLLDLTGEVITTPFSFCATSSTLCWHGLKPKFIDIDKDTFNMNPEWISSSLSDQTTAILPVHVFGNPCRMYELQKLADDHHLKLIYDAAHCFGQTFAGESLLKYGDISMISFHATKVFHSVEGGALIIKDDDLFLKAQHLINFGLDAAGNIDHIGINGKMSELHAAMGLCVLDDINDLITQRKAHFQQYQDCLAPYVEFQKWEEEEASYAYCPILLESEEECLTVLTTLKNQNIFPRRYFYPALDSISQYGEILNNCPVAGDISNRILCLPLYPSLEAQQIEMICDLIISCIKY